MSKEETQPKPSEKPVTEAQDTSAIGIRCSREGRKVKSTPIWFCQRKGWDKKAPIWFCQRKGGTRKIHCTTVEPPTPNGYMQLTQEDMKGTTPQARTISRQYSRLGCSRGKDVRDWIASLDQPLGLTRQRGRSAKFDKKGILHPKALPMNLDGEWMDGAHTPGLEEAHTREEEPFRETRADLDGRKRGMLERSVHSMRGTLSDDSPTWKERNSPPPISITTDEQARLQTADGYAELTHQDMKGATPQ